MASDALLLVGDSESNQNLYHKTHFLAGDPFVYCEVDGRQLLVVNSMEHGRARKESVISDVRTFDDFGYEELVAQSSNRSMAFNATLTRIVAEIDGEVRVESSFPVGHADYLREHQIRLRVDPQPLGNARRQKTPSEIEAIATAQRATERAAARAIEILAQSEALGDVLHFNGIPLTSERLRTEIELVLTRDGLDPGTPIVAAGTGAADPHFLGAGPIRTGEAVVLDIFPRHKTSRYYADMTRTVVKGDPGDTLRAMYRAVQAALKAALGEIRPGANARASHAAALEALRSAGFHDGRGPRMTHSTGHGIGLDIHEAPMLSNFDIELLPGDVITVEPGLYDPEVGGVRIEDLVLVTGDGYRNLTEFPQQFEL